MWPYEGRLAHSTMKADPHWGQRKGGPFLSLKTMLLINTSFLEPIHREGTDMQMSRTDLWTQWRKQRVGQTRGKSIDIYTHIPMCKEITGEK